MPVELSLLIVVTLNQNRHWSRERELTVEASISDMEEQGTGTQYIITTRIHGSPYTCRSNHNSVGYISSSSRQANHQNKNLDNLSGSEKLPGRSSLCIVVPSEINTFSMMILLFF